MIKDKLFLEEFDEESIEEAKKSKRKRRTKKTPYSSITYTTGDIGLNIDRFNTAMGTAGTGDSGDFESASDGTGLGEGLITEAKRYVRRYYARPMNIFCSNKAEVLKLLVDIGDQNCTIYTLNNLGDNKDISKLTSRDIIYTYDDGILKDKNGIRVLDYDLSIKKEEERKKLTNPDPDSKEFKAEYEDRMTAATELEESQEHTFNTELESIFDNCDYDVISADYLTRGDGIVVSLNHNVADEEEAAKHLISCLTDAGYNIIDWNTNGSNVFIFALDPENAFDLDFDDVNVYGESLTEAAKHEDCCICGETIDGSGKNPEPYMSADKGRVCDSCHLHFVAPMIQTEED